MAEVDVAALRRRVVGNHQAKEWYPLGEEEILALLDAYERVYELDVYRDSDVGSAMERRLAQCRERVAKLEQVVKAAREVADVPCIWTPQPQCGECDWCRIRAALAALDEEKGGG